MAGMVHFEEVVLWNVVVFGHVLELMRIPRRE